MTSSLTLPEQSICGQRRGNQQMRVWLEPERYGKSHPDAWCRQNAAP